MAKIVKDKYDINPKTQKFILQMCWAQHDSQWYLKTKRKYGVDVANQLNQEVILSMGKIEARHILSALGIKKGSVNSSQEFVKIINTIMDVIIPKIMKFNLIVDSDKEVTCYVDKCFTWEQVKKAGGEKTFKCSCSARQKGWTDAMGINPKIIHSKSIPEGDEICEFKVFLED